MVSFASCKQTIEYTTIAELAAKTTATPANFDIYVQNTYVTALSDGYILLQDNTGAAQVVLKAPNTELKAGQQISAHITGVGAIKNNGLELTDTQISGVSAVQAAELPFEEATLSDIQANPALYTHHRVLVKDITFAENFDGKVGDKARIVQKGKVGTVVARATKFYAISGNQGDLYVYPSEGYLYVYVDTEFSEHEVISPFTLKTVYGVYAVASEATEKVVYSAGVDQLAYGKNSQGRFSRIQSYDKERVLCVILPTSKIAQGNFIKASLQSVGFGLSDVTSQEMFVEKLTTNKMWLMDYNSGTGYIIAYEK